MIKAAEGGVLHVGKQWLEHRQGRIPYMPRESVQALDVALRQVREAAGLPGRSHHAPHAATLFISHQPMVGRGAECAQSARSRNPHCLVARGARTPPPPSCTQGGVLTPGNRVVGRGVYTTVDSLRLGFGLVAMRGYVQSINVTQSGLTVTLDPAVAAVGVVEALLDWISHVSSQPLGRWGGEGGAHSRSCRVSRAAAGCSTRDG